jgi:catechol 2,3-dioxygenase-like lactoylglutathione lyase family enzyme
MPGVTIVSIPVSDQDRAAAYYCEYLGFRVIQDNPMGLTMRWVRLAAGDEPTTITLTTWFDSMPPGSVTGLVIDVADVDAVHARLEADGHACSAMDEQGWGRFFTTSDPDGNGLVVVRSSEQPGDGSAGDGTSV